MSSPYDTQTTADILVKDYAAQIADKIILTTGCSPGGFGGFFVHQIAAASPRLLILAGRTTSKLYNTDNAIKQSYPNVPVRILHLDLESLSSVHEAANTVNGWNDVRYIDVLVNNAGIMACNYAITSDGIERQFAAGHVGPFLFTNLIMRKLLLAESPRVVNVASDGHRLSPIRWADIGFSDGKVYNKWHAYGQSKTANMLMAVSLAQKLGKDGLTAVSLHPGVVRMTNLDNHLNWDVEFPALQAVDKELGNKEGFAESFDFKTPERGVATHIYAAFEPSLENGAYLQDCHIADPKVDTVKPYAQDPCEADRLWKLSEILVGQSFTY